MLIAQTTGLELAVLETVWHGRRLVLGRRGRQYSDWWELGHRLPELMCGTVCSVVGGTQSRVGTLHVCSIALQAVSMCSLKASRHPSYRTRASYFVPSRHIVVIHR